MVSATFNSDGKLTGTGAGLPLPPARQGSLGLLLQLKIQRGSDQGLHRSQSSECFYLMATEMRDFRNPDASSLSYPRYK